MQTFVFNIRGRLADEKFEKAVFAFERDATHLSVGLLAYIQRLLPLSFPVRFLIALFWWTEYVLYQ